MAQSNTNANKRDKDDDKRRSAYNTQRGEDVARRAEKTFNKAIRQTRKQMLEAQKTASDMLDATLKTLNSYTDEHGEINAGIRENIDELDRQVDALKSAKREMETYSESLSEMGVDLSDVSEDILKVLELTIKRADTLSREYSETNEAIFANSQDIMRRVQNGLRSNLNTSQNLWNSYSSSILSGSKRFYVERLEEEQRSMADRLSWLEEYREKNFKRLSDEDKEFFDTEYEAYKRRAEELEDLIKVAGADISNSVSEQVRNIISNVRDIAVISAARDAMSEGIDSYIENKHQLMARTGENFDFDAFRDMVNRDTFNNPIMSRNAYSEVYSDMVKELRMQKVDELNDYARQMASLNKAYGTDIGSVDRLVWGDKNYDQNGSMFQNVSNIAAALEDNENLYADATKILGLINENIDSMAYLQEGNPKRFDGMLKSLAAIEAIEESSAVKGTELFTQQMKEMIADSASEYDLRENETAKFLVRYTSLRDFKDIQTAIENENLGDYVLELQNNLKNMNEGQLKGLVTTGQTPWNKVWEVNQFRDDDLTSYITGIKSADEVSEEATKNGIDLAGNKAEESNTWFQRLENRFSALMGRFTDPLGELDINWINMAARVTVISGLVDTMRSVGGIADKLSGSAFFTKLLGSSRTAATSFISGFSSVYSGGAGLAEAGTTLTTAGETLTTASSGISATLGELAGILAPAAAICGAIVAADKMQKMSDEAYLKDWEEKGRDVGSGEESVSDTFNAKTVSDYYKEQRVNSEESGPVTNSLSMSDELANLVDLGWVKLTDENGDGAPDKEEWVGKTYDPERWVIHNAESDDVFTQGPGVYEYDFAEAKYYKVNPNGERVEGSFANGLDYVPHDNFVANLHKGEAVLTKEENAQRNTPWSTVSDVQNMMTARSGAVINENVEGGFEDVTFILQSMRRTLESFFGMEEEQYILENREEKRQSLIEELFGAGKRIVNALGGGGGSASGGGGSSSGSASTPSTSSTAESTIDDYVKKVSTWKGHPSDLVSSPNATMDYRYERQANAPIMNAIDQGLSSSISGEGGGWGDVFNVTRAPLFKAEEVGATFNDMYAGAGVDAWKDHDLKSWVQTGLDAAALNKYIDALNAYRGVSENIFTGKGQVFLDAAQQSGLDPRYLIAHASLEALMPSNKNGVSRIANNKGNYFGIGAFDASPYASAFEFGEGNDAEAKFTPGIIEGAKWIARNYYDSKYGQKTVRSMRWNNNSHQYATDPGWDSKLANFMTKWDDSMLSGSAGNSTTAYAQGTPWLPDDQVAVVHQGEMIVPADNNPFNNSTTENFNLDNSDVVEIVKWMTNTLSSKFDTVISSMIRNSRRTQVGLNSDMSYVYSR